MGMAVQEKNKKKGRGKRKFPEKGKLDFIQDYSPPARILAIILDVEL